MWLLKLYLTFCGFKKNVIEKSVELRYIGKKEQDVAV